MGIGNSYVQELDECLRREDGLFMTYRQTECAADCNQCSAMAGGADCGSANDVATNFSYAVPGRTVCTYGLRDFASCPCAVCFASSSGKGVEDACARNLCEELVPRRCASCVHTSTSEDQCRACLGEVVSPPQYGGH